MKKEPKLKKQRFVSLSAGLVFIVVFISSFVLYFFPDRSVTAWTNWCFLGLDKQQWDNLHINLGLLFLFLLVWHIYYNWKPIKNYLKVKKELKVFTKEFNYSLILVLVFVVGTITMTFPMNALVNIGNGIKAKNFLNDANPPFRYAQEATLKDFCKILHIDEKKALTLLQKSNIKVNSDKQSLKDIANANNKSPKEIYDIIKESNRYNLPSDLPIGIAHKSIEELNKEYGVDIDKFINYLKYYGIKANKDITFKRLAKENSLHPATLYSMLLASQIK